MFLHTFLLMVFKYSLNIFKENCTMVETAQHAPHPLHSQSQAKIYFLLPANKHTLTHPMMLYTKTVQR